MHGDAETKCAVVTGGSRGIGAAVAGALQAAGCRVAVLARSTDHGIGDLQLACDVADEGAQMEAFAEIARRFGRLDYSFVNAGVSSFSSILDMELGEWDRVMNVNLRGALVSLRESARWIKHFGDGGSIVTCCSLATWKPEKSIAPYSASKAALANLTQTAARELGEFGIRVNGVAPGLTETDLIAGARGIPGYYDAIRKRTALQHRLGTPSDIADAVVKLLAMTWVTGQILVVDGGLSLHTPTDPTDFF